MSNDKGLDKLVSSLLAKADEDGLMPWQRCTIDGITGTDWPRNAQTGKTYRGGNWFWLRWLGAEYWAGNKQWQKLGAKVTDWNAAQFILAPTRFVAVKDTNGDKRRIPIGWKAVKVYPVTAVEGWTPPPKPDVEPVPPIEAAEALIKAMPNAPTIVHSAVATTGSYNWRDDVVTMPLRDHCVSAERYYKTTFHELVHSTGFDSRCKRDMDNFGDNHAYSREELVAEFGAAFLCAHCGITDTEANSAAYIKHWKEFIGNDPKVLVSATADAQKAVDYILNVKAAKSTGKATTGGATAA
jgi:antirestriction protein ArdC